VNPKFTTICFGPKLADKNRAKLKKFNNFRLLFLWLLIVLFFYLKVISRFIKLSIMLFYVVSYEKKKKKKNLKCFLGQK
jgi:hypothetical protein